MPSMHWAIHQYTPQCTKTCEHYVWVRVSHEPPGRHCNLGPSGHLLRYKSLTTTMACWQHCVVTKTVINIIPLPWQLLTAAYHAVSTNEAYIICNSTLSVQMMLTRTNYFSRPFLSAAVIDHHANQTITRIFSPAVKSNISPSQCFGDLLKLFLHPWWAQ